VVAWSDANQSPTCLEETDNLLRADVSSTPDVRDVNTMATSTPGVGTQSLAIDWSHRTLRLKLGVVENVDAAVSGRNSRKF